MNSAYGEAYAGSGVNGAHLNTMLGAKGSAVEVAWATALATPREGHASFVVIARPNQPVLPMTLFVNKATIASEQHATMTWGPAQLGVASGVLDAVAQGLITRESASELLLIAAVWVDPKADDADLIYENNRLATTESIRRGFNLNVTDELLALADSPLNGYYSPKR